MEHYISIGLSEEWPKSLELAMSTYEHDSFACLLRVDLERKTNRPSPRISQAQRIACETQMSHSRLIISSIGLERNKASLERDPATHCRLCLKLLSVSVIFLCQLAQRHLYRMESRLGVTERAAVFKHNRLSERVLRP